MAHFSKVAGCGSAFGWPPVRPVLAVLALSLLSGCSYLKRDHVIVGSVPDDYRTNHPIIIAEKEETLDLPVGASDRGATASQRASLEGFLAGYDKSAAPVLTIIAPSGSANARAAADVRAPHQLEPHVARTDEYDRNPLRYDLLTRGTRRACNGFE